MNVFHYPYRFVQRVAEPVILEESFLKSCFIPSNLLNHISGIGYGLKCMSVIFMLLSFI